MKKITETIKKLIAEHGSGILEQEKRLLAILADLHFDEKRNRYLIELSLRDGIPKKLMDLNNADVANNDHKINSIKHFFKAQFFLEEGAVKLVFDCWVEAIKLTMESFTENINGVNFKMIAINGGTFLMGSNDGEDDEKPVHSVTVSDFYIGENPVTQEQWVAVMGYNHSNIKGDDLPVEGVSWDEIQDFLAKLNAKTGKAYRLPTEAEWEYAGSGGENNHTKWAGTNTESSLGNFAWYYDNSNLTTHTVGTKQPNQLGLYDMSGNVWEWCNDWYGADYFANSSQNNPKGASTGTHRVLRGGCLLDSASDCLSNTRFKGTPDDDVYFFGFRFALFP